MDGGVRQQHGLDFEDWLSGTFFSSFTRLGITAKWDFTGVAYKSKYSALTAKFNGLPVSVKTCKYGTSINFGDALRQIENEEDFLLIVGFWQKAGNTKKFVSVKAVMVSSHFWKRLFMENLMDNEEEGDVYSSDEEEFSLFTSRIRKLDSVIKDRDVGYKETRTSAKKLKAALPESSMVLNPKIDSKSQRRLQCSMQFKVFWSVVMGEADFRQEECEFWGETVPEF
jgi:hypothetical protein